MDSVFIYALNCPITGRTRYVGKAKDIRRRFSEHIKRSGSTHCMNWICSLRTQGLLPVLEILDEVPAPEWQQWEVAYIQFFREEGFDLINATAGGEGAHNPSEETRAKFRNAHANAPEEVRKKRREALRLANLGNTYTLGKYHTDETRAKQSAALLGKSKSPEARANMKVAWVTRDREKQSAALRAAWVTRRERAKKKGETL